MIKFYLHVPELTGWQSVLVEMLEKMDNSGLINRADEIIFCLNGVKSNMEMFLLPILKSNPKFTAVQVHGDATKWEWPTINKIKQDADSSEDEYTIGYAHLKGLSRENVADQKAADWRNYLTYWTIEQWEKSLEELSKGVEVVGVNWLDHPFPHFSGNFWWTNNNYIRRLRKLSDPATIEWGKESLYLPGVKLDPGNFRFEHEAWIGSGKPLQTNMHSSHVKGDPSFHYNNEYPSSNYRTE
jgi:hypothetical protein